MTNRSGAYYTNQYRNVFAEYGYSDADIQMRLQNTWHNLFYGDEDTRIYYPLDNDKGYLLDTGNSDVRTEGLSYGMMICVQLDKKDEFDRLWRFAKQFMQHTEGKYKDYFAWHSQPDGTVISQGPAPDGEEFFAMALFFASKRWGDEAAPLDYSNQARTILRACVHKGEHGEEGDPMWDPATKLIKFVPETPFSDPSYHMPHFYELFALWADPQDRPFWREAAASSREYLRKACHPQTGLAPEYGYFDGTPCTERPDHMHFYSDSYRVAANIALDYEWFAADEWQHEQANHIQAFFDGIDIAEYRRYAIDGKPFAEPSLHPVGLLATNAMATLAATGPHAEQMVRRFWETPLRTGVRRYYDNCLYMFSMLALSGHYRIWQ